MADVPMLGSKPAPVPRRLALTANFMVVSRHTDENGIAGYMTEGEKIPRQWYMDGEQFMAELQGALRHELRRALTKAGLKPPDEDQTDYLTPCAVPSCDRPQAESVMLGLGEPPDQVGVAVPLCAGHIESVMSRAQPIGGGDPFANPPGHVTRSIEELRGAMGKPVDADGVEAS